MGAICGRARPSSADRGGRSWTTLGPSGARAALLINRLLDGTVIAMCGVCGAFGQVAWIQKQVHQDTFLRRRSVWLIGGALVFARALDSGRGRAIFPEKFGCWAACPKPERIFDQKKGGALRLDDIVMCGGSGRCGGQADCVVFGFDEAEAGVRRFARGWFGRRSSAGRIVAAARLRLSGRQEARCRRPDLRAGPRRRAVGEEISSFLWSPRRAGESRALRHSAHGPPVVPSPDRGAVARDEAPPRGFEAAMR